MLVPDRLQFGNEQDQTRVVRIESSDDLLITADALFAVFDYYIIVATNLFFLFTVTLAAQRGIDNWNNIDLLIQAWTNTACLVQMAYTNTLGWWSAILLVDYYYICFPLNGRGAFS